MDRWAGTPRNFRTGWLCIALGASLAIAPRSDARQPDREESNFRWAAAWVGAPGGQGQPLPLFRREFSLRGPVRQAVLRMCGLGQFEAHINGRNVTRDVLTPGWTDYRKRVLYDAYDVTKLLHPGRNAVGAMLGNGMYNVVETAGRYAKFSGSFGALKLIAQIDVIYRDGSRETIATDGNWKTAAGPVVYSSIYGGEDYDARLEDSGWDRPASLRPARERAGLDATAWTPVSIVQGPGGALEPERMPPVQGAEIFRPIRVTHPAPGVAVYDLGQNFAGRPRISVFGARGAAVKLVCGELLDERGRVTQRSAAASPDAQNEFNYILRGGGVESWTPRFTYYGFRYVEVRTLPGPAKSPVQVVSLDGEFLHDALPVDGQFRSSDRLLNRIHRLIDRAILSNAVSVLTDCPHREKLGWLEQTHLAGPSLMYNYGLSELYAKMARDMEDAQLPGGLEPSIAPEFPVFEGAFRDSPEWGSAIVLSPWAAYGFYGGVDILRAHYPAMRSYTEYLHGKLQGGLLTYGLGDWYDIGPGEPGESKLTSKGVTATATYFEMLGAMRRIALLLDRPDDAKRYAADSDAVKAAFNAAYFHPETGQYDRGSQTAQAMPLVVGLVPEDRRGDVLGRLIAAIRAQGNHVSAGDIGFHYVVRALTDGGRSDVLYEMVARTDQPSYGDQLAHGATALTEAWDANPNSSQNHFMLGHAEEWFYRGVAGIDFDLSRDGDARIRIAPAIVGDLRWAEASYRSKLGRIASRWVRHGDTVRLTVTIPRGARATVALPGEMGSRVVGQGRHRFTVRLAAARRRK